MSIVTEIKSLTHTLRSKVGALTADAEASCASFLGMAKIEEAAAEAKVEAEIAHLKSLGYTVVAKIEDLAGTLVSVSSTSAGTLDAPAVTALPPDEAVHTG